MKLVRAISTAVLSLALGAGISAYAQQEQHEQEESKDKPAQDKDQKARPEKTAKPAEKNVQENKNAKPEEKNAKQEQQRTPGAKPENQEQHASNGRIPDDRFKANFGREHSFRVSEGDYRNHRFQYGGYWFGFVDPWPSNWLYTQNVYVVDVDGAYYLCNPAYPGVNVAISVTL
ncbi:MAG: hypothetical protein WAK56_04820 [Candidatus Sulfotelmatobacter sp.]